MDKEQQVRDRLANTVAIAAARFCEELQEDAPGVPQVELKRLHHALDRWEGKAAPLPGGPYDDTALVFAALNALAEDQHATDHQRRVAQLAFETLLSQAGKLPPCGHTIADLVGGAGSVTFCGACSREKRAARV